MGRGGRQIATQGAGRARRQALPAPAGLGEEELEVIDAWCGDEVPYLVNSYLRQGRPQHDTTASDEQMTELARWYVERLDHILERAPRLERETVVYRGVSAQALAGAGPGTELSEPGFAAASLERERALAFAEEGEVLELTLPAGTPVLAIGEIEGLHRYRHEREILLPRGGAYRITGEGEGNRRCRFVWPARGAA